MHTPRKELWSLLCVMVRNSFEFLVSTHWCMFGFSNNRDGKIRPLLVGLLLPREGWVWVLRTVGVTRDSALWRGAGGAFMFLLQQVLRKPYFRPPSFEGSLHGAGSG